MNNWCVTCLFFSFLFFFFFFWLSVGATWWRVCCHQDLPRIVFENTEKLQMFHVYLAVCEFSKYSPLFKGSLHISILHKHSIISDLEYLSIFVFTLFRGYCGYQYARNNTFECTNKWLGSEVSARISLHLRFWKCDVCVCATNKL